VTGRPSHYEVGKASDLYGALTDGNPTTWTDVGGPVTNGDLAWSFQWDFTLAPGESYIISKDKDIVPEPATLALLALAAARCWPAAGGGNSAQ